MATRMPVAEFSTQQSPEWDGICLYCTHDYRNGCKGNCTCLSCNAERQADEKDAANQGIELLE